MVVIGVAVLAGCYLLGNLLGDYLGLAIGVAAVVGGLALVPVLARIGGTAEPLPPLDEDRDEIAAETEAQTADTTTEVAR